MVGEALRAEIESVVSFLCKRDPRTFKQRPSEWDSFEIIDDPREAILLASLVPDSFFLTGENSRTNPSNIFSVKLGLNLAEQWASDVQAQHPEIFEGSRRVVKFFPFWIPTYDLGESAQRKRKDRTLEEARSFVHDSDLDVSQCLFLPYYEYRGRDQSGSDIYQLGEGIYHYLVGLLLKEWGYLVCNEYVLTEFGKKSPIPDIIAFKTEELDRMLSKLRERGIIWSGAFLEELQLFGCFGKQRYKAKSSDSFKPRTEAEGVLVEIERTEQQRKGRIQVQGYLTETMGLFDEAYLGGPSLELIPGTITFSKEGELRFESPEPAHRPLQTSEHLEERKKRQLEDVREILLIQIFKNLPFHRILSICEGDNEVQTYQGLLSSMMSTDLESVLSALEDG